MSCYLPRAWNSLRGGSFNKGYLPGGRGSLQTVTPTTTPTPEGQVHEDRDHSWSQFPVQGLKVLEEAGKGQPGCSEAGLDEMGA